MDILPAYVVSEDEKLSKALAHLLTAGTIAVVVDRDGKYLGIVDDRNLRRGIKEANRVKVSSAFVRAPAILKHELGDLAKVLQKFLAGHFKALPVIEDSKIVGVIGRAEVLKMLYDYGLYPKTYVETVMQRPAYVIDEEETLGRAKTLMKNLGVHHLIVTSGGKIVGVISTLDFTIFMEKPNVRDSFQLVESITNPLQKVRVKQLYREDVVLVPPDEELGEVIKKMYERKYPYAVVVEGKRPLGIVSASDLFKIAYDFLEEKPNIVVTGLRGEDLYYYDDIYNEVLDLVKRFEKSFTIRRAELRVKCGKSVYHGALHIDMDEDTFMVEYEAHNMEDLIYGLIQLADKRLRKLKDRLKSRRVDKIVE